MDTQNTQHSATQLANGGALIARPGVTITDELVIVALPLSKTPTLTSTGKSFMLASSHGWQASSTLYKGVPVKYSVNVVVPR